MLGKRPKSSRANKFRTKLQIMRQSFLIVNVSEAKIYYWRKKVNNSNKIDSNEQINSDNMNKLNSKSSK